MEKKKIKVMFDTNTYRHIIDETADENNTKEVYSFIADAIKRKEIEAFLSETTFVIEAIVKKDRLAFMANVQPKISSTEKVRENSIDITMCIGPDEEHTVNFDECGPLREYYKKSLEMGFVIVRIPRIGGIINKEIDYSKMLVSTKENPYMDKIGDISSFISKLGAGEYQLQNLLSPYATSMNCIYDQFKGLFDDVNKMSKDAKQTAIKKVAKVIAEFSDSEAVSVSIGMDCDAFCTNDCAKSAGETSVFSEKNVKAISEAYHFVKVSPTALVELIKSN